MGKIKKTSTVHRKNPLEKQILEDTYATASTRLKVRRRQEEEEFVDDRVSKKILKLAQEQQEELEEENGFESGAQSKKPLLEDDTLGASDEDVEEDDDSDISEMFDNIIINEEDEKALAQFMSANPSDRATLADIIKEKLTEKQTEIRTEFSEAGTLSDERLEKLRPIYQRVGEVLSKYRSGKLPKAFKTLPMLSHWEEIMYITEPDKWTASSMYQATRIFASNLKEKMAQRFYNLILLPRLRDDIAETKVLNFHLYQALKKAIFKPGAFYKGIILPLCESGDCTLREATIFGSVLAKCSIPVLHSSAAILKISEMEYNAANSIFLRVLLEKKYSLPFRAIDAVVAHFLRFAMDKREMPLLWHQSLMTFAQFYKNDISTEQQEALLSLLTVQKHPHVTPEIRKELMSSTCRNNDVIPADEASVMS